MFVLLSCLSVLYESARLFCGPVLHESARRFRRSPRPGRVRAPVVAALLCPAPTSAFASIQRARYCVSYTVFI